MNWINMSAEQIERRLELCNAGTLKLQQAATLRRAAINCLEGNWVRARRLERYADRLSARAIRMINGTEG